MRSTGNLSVEARERYAYIQTLLLADLAPPARVVELGAAPGDQICQLAGLGFQATSVDIGTSADAWSDGTAGRMENMLAEAGVIEVKWDLEIAPYPLDANSFDAVVMTEVFEHLRDYPIRSLKEVERILKPGGRLYFTTPNTAYLVNRARALAGKSTATGLADWIGGVPHARHAREYTFSEVDQLMTQSGLEIVLRQSRHFHLSVGRKGYARIIKFGLAQVAKWRPTFGPQIVIVAEKPPRPELPE